MINSTVAKIRLRGKRSAIAPANRAKIFRDIRAVQISPTRNGESVSVRIYHPMTSASIWVPIPSRVVDIHTNAKLRYRKIERGYAARFKVGVNFTNLFEPVLQIGTTMFPGILPLAGFKYAADTLRRPKPSQPDALAPQCAMTLSPSVSRLTVVDLPKVAFQARFLLLNRIWHYVWRRRQRTVTFSSCAPRGIVPCARMAS